jgi:hypothetical protein
LVKGFLLEIRELANAEALKVAAHLLAKTQSSSSPVQVTNPFYFLVLNKNSKFFLSCSGVVWLIR